MATNIKGSSPGGFETSILKALGGVGQVIPPGSIVTVDGSKLTQPQLLQKLQQIADEYQAVRDARSALQEKLQATRTNRETDHEFFMQLHAVIVAMFGRKSPQLQQFGFTPMKPRVASSEKQLTAAVKRKLTRTKRHTMGKRQKQTVKANGTPDVTLSGGVVVNVTTSPVAPASEPKGSTGGTQGNNSSGS